MNWRLIIKVIGLLLFIEAGLMTICMAVGLFYDECYLPFVWPVVIAVAIGCLGLLAGRGAAANMGRKDGYLVVTLVWLVFAVIGMLPFLFSGSIPEVSGAFFETMSGFTPVKSPKRSRTDGDFTSKV